MRAPARAWIARGYDPRIVREVSEADVGANVVVVFKFVGRGKTSIVFAQTRGDASPKALKSSIYRIQAV